MGTPARHCIQYVRPVTGLYDQNEELPLPLPRQSEATFSANEQLVVPLTEMFPPHDLAPPPVLPRSVVPPLVPVFFVAGGFAHALVVDRWRATGASYGGYLAGRGHRLVGPLLLGIAAFIVMGYSNNAFKKLGAVSRSVDAGSWAASGALMLLAQWVL